MPTEAPPVRATAGDACAAAGVAGDCRLACVTPHVAQSARQSGIDAFIARLGIDAPVEPPFGKLREPGEEATELDLAEASVFWAIGFRPDCSWIEADVFVARGKPVYRSVERARSRFIPILAAANLARLPQLPAM
ncbi:hypothetical protein [Poseidonocella sp. HB161398]|uniref:hypothetical protein n=1 Tax=Poseidonocella sp. HB161398 TaxID=2320855 RepID=UPI00198021B9|nr:hypothetical protein [Poseidonocella sp. HB161398]